MYACLAVTCHLHFWQNDLGLLRATAVTRGWNGYRNKSQHRKSTLEKKILPPFQQGFEPATFQSRVRCSNHWAIPAPKCSPGRSQQHHWRWQLSVLRTEFRGLHHANSPQRNSHTNCGFYVPTPQAFSSVHWTKSWGIPQTKTCFSSGDGVQMWIQPCYKKRWSFTQPAPGLPEGGCPAISFFSYWNKLKWDKDLLAKSLPAPKKQFGFRAFSSSAPKLWNALPQTIREADSVVVFHRHIKPHPFCEWLCTITLYLFV